MKRLLKRILGFFLHDKLSVVLRYRREYRTKRMLKRVAQYNKLELIKEKSEKECVTILFFMYNISMWKYDGLMKLLLSNPKYNPVIVPFVMPERTFDINKRNRDEVVEYCIANNFPLKEGYDFESKQFLDISDINPDIVVYTQPYNKGYKNWRIEKFPNSLFVYTPYGISTSKNKGLKDTFLTNIAWKIFVSCQLEKTIYADNLSSKAIDNIAVTGPVIFDQLTTADKSKSPWRDNGKKRVIWAPHHSIDDKRGFSNSTFELFCFEMIELAKKYRDQIEIAFKPHPTLEERLIEKWGKTKTESYYNQWRQMPNTMICTGDYSELFAFSDALVHDCASFVCEYLYTQKPVLYISKDSCPPEGVANELGRECFQQHYHGHCISDIDNFIRDAVIGGNDPMKLERFSFVQNRLIPPNNRTVAENMLSELDTIFEH
ncbi:MAG: CDP-glycerol glycerophosphotransferase family protein [Muribaculaceae bacterium]|nr:CDP-glycerol glycerophosphotransferase family protein [Muribaculaceae bacterium]